MRYAVTLIVVALLASRVAAQSSFSGSLSAETLFTPANGSSALNPGNAAGIPAQTNQGDLIARGEVDDDSSRWSGAMKLRAGLADGHAASIDVNELVVSFTPNNWLTLSAGRLTEKWGSGYAWNPSGFIAPRKNASDPTDRRGLLRGVDMFKADALLAGNSVAFYALRDGGVAARASRLVGAVDVSLYFHHDESSNAALSLSTVVRESLELHAEVAKRRVLIGGQYTFSNQWNVVAELYHSDDGLSGEAWDEFRRDLGLARDRDSMIEMNKRYRPLEMQRQYLFVRAARSWNSKITTEVLMINGLRDGSALVRGSLSYALRPNLSLYLLDTEFLGAESSEMAYMQIERSTSFGARLYF